MTHLDTVVAQALAALKLVDNWVSIPPPLDSGHSTLSYQGRAGGWLFLLVAYREHGGPRRYGGMASNADGIVMNLPEPALAKAFERMLDQAARDWLVGP